MFHFSKTELRDLLKAWLAISLAFAIVLSSVSFTNLFSIFSLSFLKSLLISSLTVGIGFLFHELGHRTLARHYNCFAEFRAFNNMLILAIAMSFFGFVFAAPGAVLINGYVTREKNGKISLAGPLTNLIIAFLFLPLLILNIFPTLASYGFMINTWLALFNLIPFGNFDGRKVLYWNKPVYFTVLSISIIFMIIQPLLQ